MAALQFMRFMKRNEEVFEMHNVLYKADKGAATDEDCSNAEADDDGQVHSATRHGCGGTPHHTGKKNIKQTRPAEGPLKTFKTKNNNSRVVNSISALQLLERPLRL